MKRVSTGMFFAVLRKGVSQVLEWCLRPFGYKGKGRLARFIWEVFATCLIMIVMTHVMVTAINCGKSFYENYLKGHDCDGPNCIHSEYIAPNIYYHKIMEGDDGYVINYLTNEKTLKHVSGIIDPEREDSLVCYTTGKKYGYFNRYTGKTVIAPKYGNAWPFSEGLASVEEDGYIKFIDTRGNTVIDTQIPYMPEMEAFIFHGEYCIVSLTKDSHYGIINKKGEMVLPCEYDNIALIDETGIWRIRKDNMYGVLDKELNPIIPMTECRMWVEDNYVEMAMPDHTMRLYDMRGHLIDDCYISSVRTLEYEKDEMVYQQNTDAQDEKYETGQWLHEKGTARLRAYAAGDSYEGLMTADGRRVTMPNYKNIAAMAYDTYVCEVFDGSNVIVNGKGEVVR